MLLLSVFLCSSLTRFILSYHRFVFGLHLCPFPSPPYTRARTHPPCTLHQHLHITSMISHPHCERHHHQFYTSSSLLLTVFPCPFLSTFFFLYFLRSSFINIISRPFLLHVHYRLNLSLVSFVCLYSVVSVSLSCTSFLHCDPQAISYSCNIIFHDLYSAFHDPHNR